MVSLRPITADSREEAASLQAKPEPEPRRPCPGLAGCPGRRRGGDWPPRLPACPGASPVQRTPPRQPRLGMEEAGLKEVC